MPDEIKYRCYHFSISVIKYLRLRTWDPLAMVLSKQVMRSAMSIGANVVEARNSASRLEFKRFYEIALKSSAETSYWLCLLRDGFECKDAEIEILINECSELSRILGASVLTLKKTINKRKE